MAKERAAETKEKAAEAKNNEDIVLLCENEKYTIRDEENKSKAMAPIQITAGSTVEVVKVDKGLITKLPEGKFICDSLVYTIKDERHNLNITLLIELKGSDNEKLVKHCVDQIMDTIGYLVDEVSYPAAAKYLKQRDLVFAAIAGAPDKTIPILSNSEIKGLCQRLQALSLKRKSVKNMFSLLFYIQPDARVRNMEIRGGKAPYIIRCYNNTGGAMQYPDVLLNMLCQ